MEGILWKIDENMVEISAALSSQTWRPKYKDVKWLTKAEMKLKYY